MERELTQDELVDLYSWIDKIPLPRPKRNISREFSDGVLAAQVVKYFFPKLVDMHNYIPASSTPQKLSNWNLLSRKVFSRLNFHVPEESVRKIVLSTPGAIERTLYALREKIQNKLDEMTDLEYFTRDQEKPHTEIHHIEEKYSAGEEVKKDERSLFKYRKTHQTAQLYTDLDPSVRLILQEKEQTVMRLQETVEILQMKVSRLEHLIQLKDMRIGDLTHHLEAYKARGNKS